MFSKFRLIKWNKYVMGLSPYVSFFLQQTLYIKTNPRPKVTLLKILLNDKNYKLYEKEYSENLLTNDNIKNKPTLLVKLIYKFRYFTLLKRALQNQMKTLLSVGKFSKFKSIRRWKPKREEVMEGISFRKFYLKGRLCEKRETVRFGKRYAIKSRQDDPSSKFFKTFKEFKEFGRRALRSFFSKLGNGVVNNHLNKILRYPKHNLNIPLKKKMEIFLKIYYKKNNLNRIKKITNFLIEKLSRKMKKVIKGNKKLARKMEKPFKEIWNVKKPKKRREIRKRGKTIRRKAVSLFKTCRRINRSKFPFTLSEKFKEKKKERVDKKRKITFYNNQLKKKQLIYGWLRSYLEYKVLSKNIDNLNYKDKITIKKFVLRYVCVRFKYLKKLFTRVKMRKYMDLMSSTKWNVKDLNNPKTFDYSKHDKKPLKFFTSKHSLNEHSDMLKLKKKNLIFSYFYKDRCWKKIRKKKNIKKNTRRIRFWYAKLRLKKLKYINNKPNKLIKKKMIKYCTNYLKKKKRFKNNNKRNNLLGITPNKVKINSFLLFLNTIINYPFFLKYRHYKTLSNSYFSKNILREGNFKIKTKLSKDYLNQTLLNFLENTLNTNIALTVKTNPTNLIFFDHRYYNFCEMLCLTTANSNKYRFNGKINFYQFSKILYIMFHSKDIYLFKKYYRKIFKKFKLWEHKRFFRAINGIFHNFFLTMVKTHNLKGYQLEIRGKIARAGKVRKKKIMKKVRNSSKSNYANRVMFIDTTLGTISGVLSFRLWIYY